MEVVKVIQILIKDGIMTVSDGFNSEESRGQDKLSINQIKEEDSRNE